MNPQFYLIWAANIVSVIMMAIVGFIIGQGEAGPWQLLLGSSFLVGILLIVGSILGSSFLKPVLKKFQVWLLLRLIIAEFAATLSFLAYYFGATVETFIAGIAWSLALIFLMFPTKRDIEGWD